MTCLKTAKAATHGTNGSYCLSSNPMQEGKDLLPRDAEQVGAKRRQAIATPVRAW
jgi:hypothetical protein